MSVRRDSAELYDGFIPLSILDLVEHIIRDFKYDKVRPGCPCPTIAQESLDLFNSVNINKY